jgi:hypothetical protein
LNAYYFFVLGWCAGDVMQAFTAFLNIAYVGEKDSPKKTPENKKQRTNEMKTLIASNDLSASLMDDRMKRNSLVKGLENNANRLLKAVQGERDRKSNMLFELSKLSRVKPKHQNDLHRSTVSALVKVISEHDTSITTMEMSMQHASDELSIAYQEIAESWDKPAGVDAFNTPASRRLSIASSAHKSTTSVPLAAFGSGTTSSPSTPDSDEFNDDDNDKDNSDDSNRNNKQAGV